MFCSEIDFGLKKIPCSQINILPSLFEEKDSTADRTKFSKTIR
jgi:hypothetical protein